MATDLAKQEIDLDKQQINFIGKLNEDATIFLIIEKKRKSNIKILTKFC